MYGLSDERIEAGEMEEIEEPPIDIDVAEKTELPTFEWEDLQRILQLQKGETTQKIISAISNNTTSPDKTAVMAEDAELRNFYKNRSLYKLSKQQVLFRVWINRSSDTKALIVVGKEEYCKLIHETHFGKSSPVRHTGQRKTFSYLNKSYYSFEARDSVNHIVSKCPVCRLNNYPRGNATKTGNQIELAPNQTGQMDFCGPLHGFCQTQAGNPRYLLVFVDTHSRFTIVVVTSSTADKEVLRSLRVIKDKLCGLPNRIICDNAILTKNSDSLQYCKDNGVAVAHGLPHISRSQSKVERQIQNIMRLICKLHTESPNLPFQRLVEDATFILNSTPNDGLGGELSPKELFFSNAPSNLPRMKPLAAGPLRRARLASQESAINEVRRFMKNRVKTSPTDYSQRLKPGTLALKKRTSFPTS